MSIISKFAKEVARVPAELVMFPVRVAKGLLDVADDVFEDEADVPKRKPKKPRGGGPR